MLIRTVICYEKLGEGLARIHSIDNVLLDEVKFNPGSSPNHIDQAKERIKRIDEIIDQLQSSSELDPESAYRLRFEIEQHNKSLFHSKEVLNHGDIHNENVILNWWSIDRTLVFIDWETCMIQAGELDLVHPYLNIIGESFPGRRMEGKFSKFKQSFEDGYGKRLNWDSIAVHAAIWYLEKASTTRNKKERAFFINTALGAVSCTAELSV